MCLLGSSNLQTPAQSLSLSWHLPPGPTPRHHLNQSHPPITPPEVSVLPSGSRPQAGDGNPLPCPACGGPAWGGMLWPPLHEVLLSRGKVQETHHPWGPQNTSDRGTWPGEWIHSQDRAWSGLMQELSGDRLGAPGPRLHCPLLYPLPTRGYFQFYFN